MRLLESLEKYLIVSVRRVKKYMSEVMKFDKELRKWDDVVLCECSSFCGSDENNARE